MTARNQQEDEAEFGMLLGKHLGGHQIKPDKEFCGIRIKHDPAAGKAAAEDDAAQPE